MLVGFQASDDCLDSTFYQVIVNSDDLQLTLILLVHTMVIGGVLAQSYVTREIYALDERYGY